MPLQEHMLVTTDGRNHLVPAGSTRYAPALCGAIGHAHTGWLYAVPYDETGTNLCADCQRIRNQRGNHAEDTTQA